MSENSNKESYPEYDDESLIIGDLGVEIESNTYVIEYCVYLDKVLIYFVDKQPCKELHKLKCIWIALYELIYNIILQEISQDEDQYDDEVTDEYGYTYSDGQDDKDEIDVESVLNEARNIEPCIVYMNETGAAFTIMDMPISYTFGWDKSSIAIHFPSVFLENETSIYDSRKLLNILYICNYLIESTINKKFGRLALMVEPH